MLLGSNRNLKLYSEEFEEKYVMDMEYCAQLINNDQYEEAWTLLVSLRPESIPLLFNKAVLLINASANYGAALPLLEKAWMLVASIAGSAKAGESPELAGIRQTQAASQSYRRAVSMKYVDMFTHLLKESILRLMVDCHLELGNSNKIIEIGSPLESKGYGNIKEALIKVKNLM